VKSRYTRPQPGKASPDRAEALRREIFRYRKDLQALLAQLDAADSAITKAARSIETKDRYIENLQSALERAEGEYRKLAAAVSALIPDSSSSRAGPEANDESGRADVGDACLAAGAQRIQRECAWKPAGAAADALPFLTSALAARGKRLADSSTDTVHAAFAACTIVARNYVSLARVWARSLRRHNPEAAAYVLLVDRLEGEIELAEEPFELIQVSELGIPDFSDLAFKYNILELSTAVKPFLLEYIMSHRGVDHVIYFDPDIQILGPLTLATTALIDENIVLVPHLVSPLPEDGKRPSEPDFLVSGTYNLGFLGLRNTPETVEFLRWWQERLVDRAFSRPEIGQFTDQKWIDLVPALFPRVAVLRDRGYNVAYWNIAERLDLEKTLDDYRVGKEPLTFFHFSGLDFDRPETVSKYQNRFSLTDLNDAYRTLFHGYVEAVRADGFEQTRSWPYAFGSFSDGTPIPPVVRRLYHSQGEMRRRWADPFRAEGEESFLAWSLASPSPDHLIPRILLEIWRLRPDLQRVFPEVESGDGRGLLQWAIVSTPTECGFPPRFLTEFQRLLAELPEDKLSLPRAAGGPAGSTLGELRHLSAKASLDPNYHSAPTTPAKRLLKRLTGREIYRAARGVLWHFRAIASQPVIGDSAVPRRASARIARRLLGADRYRRARRAIWEWRRLRSLSNEETLASGPPRPHPVVVSASPDPLPFGVNLFGYLDTESGIGEIARQVSKTLHRADISHVLRNVEQQWLRRPHSSSAAFANANPYAINLFCINADQVPHVLSGLPTALTGRLSVGYWFWELAKFPPVFRSSFENLSEVWVASTFCERAVSAVSPIPVVRVAPGFDIRPPKRSGRRNFGIGDDDFVVLYVFDAASWISRKNPAAVVTAFRRAFPEPGQELLLLKVTNVRPSTLAALKRIAGKSRMRIIDEALSRDALLDLISLCDCYLSLHRSEGFGLTILEAMAMGKPVIATDYSGSCDFLNESNGFPVRHQLEPIRRAAGPYPQGYLWANPDVDQAAELIRQVRRDPEQASRRAKSALETFITKWSLAAGAERFRIELRRLWTQTL
jgi:glycosyltransferase involved in cell wall biosynthesis